METFPVGWFLPPGIHSVALRASLGLSPSRSLFWTRTTW